MNPPHQRCLPAPGYPLLETDWDGRVFAHLSEVVRDHLPQQLGSRAPGLSASLRRLPPVRRWSELRRFRELVRIAIADWERTPEGQQTWGFQGSEGAFRASLEALRDLLSELGWTLLEGLVTDTFLQALEGCDPRPERFRFLRSWRARAQVCQPRSSRLPPSGTQTKVCPSTFPSGR